MISESDNKQSILDQVADLIRERKEAELNLSFVPGETVVPYAGRVYDHQEVIAAVSSSLDFMLTLGEHGKELERELAKYIGSRHSLLTNSGSSANLLAFATLTSPKLPRPIQPSDEVITVAAGFPTTVNPIVQYGCVPVFLDIDAETANIDVEQLEAGLSDKTRAIMIAHTLGNPFNLEVVQKFCTEHELFLIEDNCDALGSLYNGKMTGTFGDLSTSSFYPPHHITMGEGGAVYMNSSPLKKICESFRDWGRDCWCPSGVDDTCGKRFAWNWKKLPPGYDHKYVYSHIGYNLKPTDIQAAIGREQLKKLPSFIEARKVNHAFYREQLAELQDNWIFQSPTQNSDPSWFGFLMTMRSPNHEQLSKICQHLAKAKIGHRRLFAGNLLLQPAYADVPHRVVGDLPNTNSLCQGGLFFGVYPGLTDEMRDYVVDTVKQCCTFSSKG